MSHTIDPPVKCGYCGWLIGGCQNIIQHKCLEHFNEETQLLNVDENFVITLIARKDFTTAPNTEHVTQEVDQPNAINEKLIEAVCARPGLYNVKLPVKQRTKLKKDALWLEVTHVLNGIMTTEAIKKRWQYLRDCFLKARNKVLKYQPSGSAAEIMTSGAQSFRFYQQMSFLCDSLPSVITESNIEPLTSVDSGCSESSSNFSTRDTTVPSGSSSNSSTRDTTVPSGPSSGVSIFSPVEALGTQNDLASPSPPPRTPTPGTRKRKLSEDKNADLRAALVTALQEQVPQPDAVDGFLARLGEGLRRIPYRERSQLEIKFLTMIMEIEDRLNLPQ